MAEADSSNNVRIFKFRELATATKDFKDESFIGQGGFGAVYKGKLEKTGQVFIFVPHCLLEFWVMSHDSHTSVL